MKTPNLERTQELTLAIIGKLRECGIPAHLLGYEYLKEAIGMVLENPWDSHNIVRILYPAIAEEYGTTPSRVERAIRHALELAWLNGNLVFQEKYFGSIVKSSSGKPTNSEFIFGMAEVVREEVGAYRKSPQPCDCYHIQGGSGVCWGTREKDPCSCGGDRTRCTYYPSRV